MITLVWKERGNTGHFTSGKSVHIYYEGWSFCEIYYLRHGKTYRASITKGEFCKTGNFKSRASARKWAEAEIDKASIRLFNDDDVTFTKEI